VGDLTYGIDNNAVYIVEINAIEIRKISFLFPIFQDIFEGLKRQNKKKSIF